MKSSRVQIIGKVHYGYMHMHVDATYENATELGCMDSFQEAVNELQKKIKKDSADSIVHFLRSAHLCYLELSSKGENRTAEESEFVESYKEGTIQEAIKRGDLVILPIDKNDWL